jgi:DNA-binding GntR family transcriptional regulator
VREHERIVAALESGDIETAGEEIERNWRVSLEWVSERQPSAGRPMQ